MSSSAFAPIGACLAGALLLTACTEADTAQSPRVRTQAGWVEGSTADGIVSFKGIPYAQPPIGDLRWRAPEPVHPWDGTLDAGDFGPSCVQQSIPPASLYHDPPDAMSEDCLSLNVWAPEDAENAPVIVWIHGGSLRIGGAAQSMYDGRAFAERGIVFVSINYRLGALGWMAHPDLSAESAQGVSGNYGLLDQIEALRWVQANAGAFGGDANNVTVMGESAGALSVTYLLTSPLADGLFDKAIAQSTNLRAFPELRDPAFGLPSAECTGLRIGESVGRPSLAELRAMDAQALTDATARSGFISQGTIDGWALPGQIIDILDHNTLSSVPLLVGFNSGELRTQRALLPPIPDTPEDYERIIRCGYGDRADAFLNIYPATDPAQSTLDAFRDTVYGWAGERLARAQADQGVSSYLYMFDHCYDAARNRDICAFHASELPFVFGQTGEDAALTPNWPAPRDEADTALSQAMMDYWVSFATTGQPVSDGGPDWQPYANGQSFMRFDGVPHLERDPVPGMYEMHSDWVARQRARGEQWFLQIGVNAPQTCVAEPDTAD